MERELKDEPATPAAEPGTAAREQVGLPSRAVMDEHQRILQSLNMLGSGGFTASTRDGAQLLWQRFHRRCAPDWQRLEPAE